MAPLGKVAGGRKRWIVDTTAYNLAGGVASAAIGSALGQLGDMFALELSGRRGLLIVLAVAVFALARELGVLPLPLPQSRRQTRDTWARMFPSTVAAALWGLDVGLVFTTRLTFAGVWLLVVVAILASSPAFGATLFATYWLGRSLSVWLAPLLLRDASATSQLLAGIAGQRQLAQRIHAAGLAWAVVVLGAALIHGSLL